MSRDFQSDQIRNSRLIASRSSGLSDFGAPDSINGPSLLIYSASVASNYSGGTTDTSMLSDAGSDVWLFVSGTKNTDSSSPPGKSSGDGVVLFGGDVVVSGTFYADKMVVEVDEATTGSLWVSGSLVVSQSATIYQGLTVNSSQEDQDTIIYNTNGSVLTIDSGGATFNDAAERNTSFRVETANKENAIFVDGWNDKVLILSGGASTDPNEKMYSDTNFFVSGTIGSKDSSTKGTSVFGGDVVISGSLTDGEGNPIAGGGGETVGWFSGSSATHGNLGIQPDWISTSGSLAVSGSFATKTNISGSHQLRIGGQGSAGTDFTGLAAFVHHSAEGNSSGYAGLLVSASHDSYSGVFIDSYRQDRFNASHRDLFIQSGPETFNTPTTLDGRVFILSGTYSDSSSPDEASFTDTNFFVSGTIGAKDSSVKGVSVFGGDTIVSGALYTNTVKSITDSDNYIELGTEANHIKIYAGGSEKVNISATDGLEVDAYVAHLGDGDTYLYFGDDSISLYAGGKPGLKISEAATDVVHLGGAGHSAWKYDQVFIMSGGNGASPSEGDYSDLSFFVSGSIGSKDSTTKGVAVFGGDVVISGSHYGLDDIVISSNATISGSNLDIANKVRHIGDTSTNISFDTEKIEFGLAGDSGLALDRSPSNAAPHVTFNLEGNNFDFGVVGNDDAIKIYLSGTSATTQNLYLSASQVLIGTGSKAVVGDDTVFFVSGAIGSKGTSDRGTSVFAGDVVVSGTLYALENGISGSYLQTSLIKSDHPTEMSHLTLDAGGNIYLDSYNYGNVVLMEGSVSYLKFERGDTTAEDNNAIIQNMEDGKDIIFQQFDGNETLRLTDSKQVLVLSGGAADSIDEAVGLDVAFYVSGSASNKDSVTHKGTSLFGGDVIASGNLYTPSGQYHYFNGDTSQYIRANGTTLYIESDDYLSVKADNTFKVYAPTIQLNRDYVAGSFILYGDASTEYIVRTDNSANKVFILSGTTSSPDSPNEWDYTDTAFFVSGSIGSKDTSTKGTSVFGGDLFVSGGLSAISSEPHVITSLENAANSIYLHADGGTSETIKIHSNQGTGVLKYGGGDTKPSIYIVSDDGGVGLESNADLAKSVYIHADGGTSSQIVIRNRTGTGGAGAGAIHLITDAAGDLEADIGGDISLSSTGAFDVAAGAASVIDTTVGTITIDGKTGVNLQENGVSVISIDDNKDITILTSNDGTHADPDFEITTGLMLLSGKLDQQYGDVNINYLGGNYDFKVSSDDNAKMLFLDGENNTILIGGRAYTGQETNDIFHILQGDYDKSSGLRIEHLMDSGASRNNSGSLIFSHLNDGGSPGVRTSLAEIIAEPLGNLVLSASKQDTDIIFKVNDGGTSKELLRMVGDSGSVLVLSGGASSSVDEAEGTDVSFYVSGSSSNKDSVTHKGTSLFGGDLVVSGAIHGGEAYPGEGTELSLIGDVVGIASSTDYEIGEDVAVYISGSADTKDTTNKGVTVLAGDTVISGALYGGFDSEAAGNYVNVVSDVFWFSDKNGWDNDLVAEGTDTNFIISGSIGTRGTDTQGTAVFGGDVVISGALYGGSPLEIGTDIRLHASNGSTQYLNFGATDGTSGYGIRANAGVIESKDNGGSWLAIEPGVTLTSGSETTGSVTTLNLAMLGSLLDLGDGEVAITGTIGNSNVESYSEGLFSTFDSTTPIGHAINKLNEVLKYLSPSPSPNLDNIGTDNTGINAKIAGEGAPGFVSISANPGGGLTDVANNDTYQVVTASNNIRMGIFNSSTNIEGDLNSDVSSNLYSNDVLNYSGSSFGDGNLGTLALNVNGVNLVSVDLTLNAAGAGNPGFGTATQLDADGSGFIELSQSGSAYQANGQTFGLFQNRTGKFRVNASSQNNGWNYAKVTHTVGSDTRTTNYVEWVVDPSGSNNVSVANARLPDEAGLSLGGSIWISGIQYATSAVGNYLANIEDYYEHVFTQETVTFGTTNCTISTQTIPTSSGGVNSYSEIVPITGSFATDNGMAPGDTISVNLSVPHIFKSDVSNAGSVTSSPFLVYSSSYAGTGLFEDFNRENDRILSASYNVMSTVPVLNVDHSNNWDVTASLEMRVTLMMDYKSMMGN